MNEPIDLSTRRFLKAVGAGAAVLAAGCASRPKGAVPEEGFEYKRISPAVPTVAAKGKIEVVEFFWYSCPFCNAMEPLIHDWLGRQPADVAFRAVHPGISPSWRANQQLHYTLEALGKADDLRKSVFSAIHDGGTDLGRRDQMASFAAGLGVDRQKFLQAFDSPAVAAKMREATDLAKAYRIDGVPMFGINGKWLTSPSLLGGSYTETFRVIEYLLALERKGTA